MFESLLLFLGAVCVRTVQSTGALPGAVVPVGLHASRRFPLAVSQIRCLGLGAWAEQTALALGAQTVSISTTRSQTSESGIWMRLGIVALEFAVPFRPLLFLQELCGRRREPPGISSRRHSQPSGAQKQDRRRHRRSGGHRAQSGTSPLCHHLTNVTPRKPGWLVSSAAHHVSFGHRLGTFGWPQPAERVQSSVLPETAAKKSVSSPVQRLLGQAMSP